MSVTDTTVELFKSGTRVASHLRSHKANFTSTNSEHMPKHHREHSEWSPSRMLDWGKSIGVFTECCFQRLMDQCEHPELAYKQCLGIIGLSKKFERERLENACERALSLERWGIRVSSRSSRRISTRSKSTENNRTSFLITKIFVGKIITNNSRRKTPAAITDLGKVTTDEAHGNGRGAGGATEDEVL